LHFQVHPCGAQELLVDPLPKGSNREGALYPDGAHITDLKQVREILYEMQRPAITPSVSLYTYLRVVQEILNHHFFFSNSLFILTTGKKTISFFSIIEVFFILLSEHSHPIKLEHSINVIWQLQMNQSVPLWRISTSTPSCQGKYSFFFFFCTNSSYPGSYDCSNIVSVLTLSSLIHILKSVIHFCT
jgi:hypothetical protein